MSIYPIFKQLSNLDIKIENLYLDPNNPRFISQDWINIKDEDIDLNQHQESSMKILSDKFEIDKIRLNMEVNGYLPIDRIVVREFKEGKYVILEGNRRICAAKQILSASQKGADISEEVVSSVRVIPCLLYTGHESNAAWVFQGIRHITGVVEWSAFNKAKLLVEQMESEGLTATEVGKRFGLSHYGAMQWVRGYQAFNQAKEKTDYSHLITEKVYSYFQELFGRSNTPLREWLDWNEQERYFKNELAFNEFVGWLYSTSGLDEDDIANQKAFQSVQDLRKISYLLKSVPDLFQNFRDTRNLENSYSMALTRKYEQQSKEQEDREAEVWDSIKTCHRILENIPFKMIKKGDVGSRLQQELENLQNVINSVQEALRDNN